MKKMKVSDLVLDFELYPRGSVDSHHVHNLVEAMGAEAVLPPVVVDGGSGRVIDGFHRVRAYEKTLGAEGLIDVVEKRYPTEGAMFLDAMRLNASHGRGLTSFDRTHCAAKADNFKLSCEEVAGALNLTVTALGELRAARVGRLRGPGARAVPLKRTIGHMAGQSLTRKQLEANGKLGGQEQGFYVTQLILLLENNLLDMENGVLMTKLERLRELMAGLEVGAA